MCRLDLKGVAADVLGLAVVGFGGAALWLNHLDGASFAATTAISLLFIVAPNARNLPWVIKYKDIEARIDNRAREVEVKMVTMQRVATEIVRQAGRSLPITGFELSGHARTIEQVIAEHASRTDMLLELQVERRERIKELEPAEEKIYGQIAAQLHSLVHDSLVRMLKETARADNSTMNSMMKDYGQRVEEAYKAVSDATGVRAWLHDHSLLARENFEELLAAFDHLQEVRAKARRPDATGSALAEVR